MKLSLLLAGVVLTIAPLAARQGAPITAKTGPAELIETGGSGAFFALPEAEYLALAAKLAAMPAFVTMKKKPAAAGPDTRYGVNFTYGGKNRTWALMGNEATGYTLCADLNANGDLSDDPPMKMTLKDGKYSTYFETTVGTGAEAYPIRMKLVVDRLMPPGKTDKELALLTYGNTRRGGEIVVAGKPVKFTITGSGGIYNQSYQGIQVDLNGDGQFDPIVEGYLNSEKFFNIGEVTYEFSVDRFGRSLTLTPLGEKKPARVVLLPGYVAPDMSFVDLQGAKRKLSDLKGKVVLVDFWGTWCGPCVASIPELLSAYEKYHARGFEIVGVDTGDTKEKLQAFLADRKIAWTQTMEADDGPMATAFRVIGFPSYFLIDRDGKFAKVAANGDKFDLPAELARLFDGK